MSISAVSSTDTSYYTTAASSSQVDNPDSALSKTDFLEMFITKLKYQDPLNVEDSDFTGDMAEYSALEQMQNMNTAMTEMSEKLEDINTNLISQMTLTNTGQAVSLVGKTASVQTTDSLGNVTATATGTVTSVKFVDGVPVIVINGIEYALSDVTEVTS